MLRTGRWLAWLLLDQCQPDDGMPSRRSLRWNSRRVVQSQRLHHWSEGWNSVGTVPCVETHLHRVDVTRRIGAAVTLWRTEVRVQLWAGQVVTLERHRSWSSEAAARADFRAHCEQVRAQLPAGSRTPAEWMEG
jgi:hypothetical protein